MAEPDNTPKPIPNLMDYNPYAKPVTPTREFEQLQNRLNKYQRGIEKSNEERKAEVSRLQHRTVFVYCKMCSGKLDRKKSVSKDIGFGIQVNIQRWVCCVCKSVWHGFIPHVVHETDTNLEADIVEYNQ